MGDQKKFAFVVRAESLSLLEKKLDAFAPPNWRNEEFFLLREARQNESSKLHDVSAELFDIGIVRVYLIGFDPTEEKKLRTLFNQLIPIFLTAREIRGDRARVREILKSHKICFMQDLTDRLSHFQKSKIDAVKIEKWMLQFERLGSNEWIANRLLRDLVIVKLHDLKDTLKSGANGTEIFAFNQDKWGKSWAMITSLLSEVGELLPIHDAIESKPVTDIFWCEDGLFSGTETKSVRSSLANEGKKVPPLADPKALGEQRILMRYGVVCDFGKMWVDRHLHRKNLKNLSVSVGLERQTTINVLGPMTKSLIEDFFWKDDAGAKELLVQQVKPHVLRQNGKFEEGQSKNNRARLFLEEIGAQLWEQFLKQQNKLNDERWPASRIRRCGLGMEGLGLCISFPHSVPRATLPVFWASGSVSFEGKTMQWEPLF